MRFGVKSKNTGWLGAAILAGVIFFAGCASTPKPPPPPPPPPDYVPVGHLPKNPKNVVVHVSLTNGAVYVWEKDDLLFMCSANFGKEGFETPVGDFKVINKIKNKRSGVYGFWVKDQEIIAGKSTEPPPGGGYKYIGYPMGYWVEFKPGYGFHRGEVTPQARSHGCIRLHANAAPTFYEIVKVGNPVLVREQWPEDFTVGYNMDRPQDAASMDPPAYEVIQESFFDTLPQPLLETPQTPAPAPADLAPFPTMGPNPLPYNNFPDRDTYTAPGGYRTPGY